MATIESSTFVLVRVPSEGRDVDGSKRLVRGFGWLCVGAGTKNLLSLATRRRKLSRLAATVRGLSELSLGAGILASTKAEAKALPMERHVSRAITVRRPIDEVYRFWRDLETFPHVDFESDAETKNGYAAANVEIVLDVPNEAIAWCSVEDAPVKREGSVRFKPAPGGQGTEMRVDLRYAAQGGMIGTAFTALSGVAAGPMLDGDLRRLKQTLETGEIVRSDASIHFGMHAARPSRVTSPIGVQVTA